MIDSEGEIVNSYIDKSGIHYLGNDIRHTTVSGTLVFKSMESDKEKRHYLQAWYIQNPYTKVKINSVVFPVASFVVKEKSSKGYRMSWERHHL